MGPTNMRHLHCSFESWVGQESKLLAAGYISTKAGGPKKAFFDKEAQDKIGNVQEVGQPCLLLQSVCICCQSILVTAHQECLECV